MQKLRKSVRAINKMAVIKTGVVEKQYRAFALFSNSYHPQTDKVYINKRLNEGRIKERP